jgi:hypothetical protein
MSFLKSCLNFLPSNTNYICLVAVLVLYGFSLQQTIANDSTKVKSTNKLYKSYYQDFIKHIEFKQFDQASKDLVKISRLDTLVPDEIAYFIGYVQVNTGKYTQGKESLEKYISLVSDTGKYADYANFYIHLADCNIKGHYYELNPCENCQSTGYSKIECSNCKGKGQELCNKCFGRGVIKSKDSYGEIFIPCARCSGLGYYQCSKCYGSKKENAKCGICEGIGKIKVKKECNTLPKSPSSK